MDIEAQAVSAIGSDLALADLRGKDGPLTGRLNAGGHRLRVASALDDVSLGLIAA